MDFRILGPLEVVDDGRSLPLGGGRQRALLAALLLRANSVVAADTLLDEVWGDDPPASRLKIVQVYISQLRKLLGNDVIETHAPGYALVVCEGELDLQRFESLVAEARAADTTTAAAKLRKALSLWRGPPLADFGYASFARAEIGRLEELRLSALEARIEADLELGGHTDLVGELEGLTAEHPLRERLRGQLMLALYRSGRQPEALAAYQDGSRRLREDLALEPSRPLRELEQAILRQDTALDLIPDVPASAEARGIFVGRHAELGTLIEGLEDAIAGRGRLFLVVGEPGIGKSRLAEELIAQARVRGTTVLVGRAWEAGGAPAYWPWVQALRAYVREADASSLPELFPDVPAAESDDSLAARFRLFEAVTSFLRTAAVQRPIVLVLDDLHAADTPSLLLLQFLARELVPLRILVVAISRDVDPLPSAELGELFAELVREPAARRIELTGLNEEDIGAYVAQSPGGFASPELITTLHARTDGNPLFVTETMRLLALDGEEAVHAIPASAREVIARRLDRLSGDCSEVITRASVLGREFALEALARLCGRDVGRVLDILDEASANRLLTDVPGIGGLLRFAHVLIRDALYEGLTPTRRVRLHRETVAALEGLYGDEAGPHLAELAHHAIAGSDLEKGLIYARRAGDRALDSLAYEEASRLYRVALAALDRVRPGDDPERCELLLSLGEADQRAGAGSASKKSFLAAAELARAHGLRRELARAAVGYGGRSMFARAAGDPTLVPLLEEALVVVPDENVELRVRLMARLAGALRDERVRDRRDRLSREALELARASGSREALVYAVHGRTAAIIAPDTVDECITLSNELIEVAEPTSDSERIFYGLFGRLVAGVVRGDLDRVDHDLKETVRLAEAVRQPQQLYQARAAQAMVALSTGKFGEAVELIERAHTLGEPIQPDMANGIYVLQRHTLLDFTGSVGEIEDTLAELATRYPARPVLRCALAHTWTRLGRERDARGVLRALAEDGFTAVPFDQEWLLAISFLAETAVRLGEVEPVEVLYGLLRPWAPLNVADYPEAIRGSVGRYLGLLAGAIGNRAEAAVHYEAALAANERMGVLPWVARTQHDYGELLIGREDGKRGAELLAAAKAAYTELGIAPS